MTRTNTQTRNPDQRIFASPVALSFVRIVTQRRGISEAQARKGLSRLHQPIEAGGQPRAPKGRAMT